jgi:hypothetical protein
MEELELVVHLPMVALALAVRPPMEELELAARLPMVVSVPVDSK